MSKKLSTTTLEQLSILAGEMSNAAAPDKFSFGSDGTLRWLDCEGDTLEVYGPRMVQVLLSLDKDGLYEFVMQTTNTRTRAHDQGYKAGYESGRRRIINTVHELLGIDKIVAAVESMGPV